MLPKGKVFQTIKEGKEKLDMKDAFFHVSYAKKLSSHVEKRAEITIMSEDHAEITLYPNATLFSVHHELCHAKLFRMGIPLTNTEKDLELFSNLDDYRRMVDIVEYYINELQRKHFQEYYAINEAGTPPSPPYPGLPKLPEDKFTEEQVREIIEIAKKAGKDPAS